MLRCAQHDKPWGFSLRHSILREGCQSSIASRFSLVLIHLAHGFETAAHARNILEAVFDEVSGGAETAVAVIAVDDNRGLFVGVLDKLLNIAVMKMTRAGYMGRAIGSGIAN